VPVPAASATGVAVTVPTGNVPVAATVQEHFRRGDPTAGLVAGIEEIGAHLARHFPRKDRSQP